MNSRFAVGTVQFGLVYGVANQSGKVEFDAAAAIVEDARRLGIDTLDTAIAYGESESVLGQIGVRDFRVVTKLPALPEDSIDVNAWVDSQITASFARLGVADVHAVLLHRPDQLLSERGEELYAALESLKSNGRVKKIGISVYGPQELDVLFNKFDLDLVQSPLSILDQRLVDSGWARKIREAGAELHVRSIFLQGLLLMHKNSRPAGFDRWQPFWTEWDDWLARTGLSPLQACLQYVLSIREVDRVVVGIDSLAHLGEIAKAGQGVLPELPRWSSEIGPELLNPALWKSS